MINMIEEAVPWVMRERGYEWLPRPESKIGGFWDNHKRGEFVKTNRVALIDCLNLDVLADEIWQKHKWFISLDLRQSTVLINGQKGFIASMGMEDVHAAALIATGRALKAMK